MIFKLTIPTANVQRFGDARRQGHEKFRLGIRVPPCDRGFLAVGGLLATNSIHCIHCYRLR